LGPDALAPIRIRLPVETYELGDPEGRTCEAAIDAHNERTSSLGAGRITGVCIPKSEHCRLKRCQLIGIAGVAQMGRREANGGIPQGANPICVANELYVLPSNFLSEKAAFLGHGFIHEEAMAQDLAWLGRLVTPIWVSLDTLDCACDGRR
jgi:hypothetical protein